MPYGGGIWVRLGHMSAISVLLFRLQKYVRGGGVAAVDVFLVDRLQTKDPRYM